MNLKWNSCGSDIPVLAIINLIFRHAPVLLKTISERIAHQGVKTPADVILSLNVGAACIFA